MHNSDQQKLHTGLRFFANKRFPGAPVGGLQLRPRQNRFSFSQRSDLKMTLKTDSPGIPRKSDVKAFSPNPPPDLRRVATTASGGPGRPFSKSEPRPSPASLPCLAGAVAQEARSGRGKGERRGTPGPRPSLRRTGYRLWPRSALPNLSPAPARGDPACLPSFSSSSSFGDRHHWRHHEHALHIQLFFHASAR